MSSPRLLLRLLRAELRQHRGRGLALVATVALAATLLATTAVLGSSLQRAVDQGLGAELDGADVVLRTDGMPLDAAAVRELRAIEGVEAVATLTRAQAAARAGSTVRGITLESLTADPAFRWQRFDDGRRPRLDGEVALTRHTLDELGITLGDRVAIGTPGVGTAVLVVVGVVDTRGSGAYAQSSYGLVTSAVARTLAGSDGPTTALLRLAPDAVASSVVERVNADVPIGWAQTTDDVVAAGAGVQGDRLRALDAVGTGLGATALAVAGLVLLTVSAVSFASRRRTTALLRCVGATRGQVVGLVFAEVVVLGLVGGVLGAVSGPLVARGALPLVGRVPGLVDVPGDAFTVPVGDLVLTVVACVGIAFVAAIVPAWRSGRTRPAVALSEAAVPERRSGTATTVVVVALLLAGAVLLRDPAADATGRVAAGAAALTLGALVGLGPLITGLARAARARLSPGRRPVARLLAGDLAADSRRVGAEGVAVVLATALVTLTWVGLSSVAETTHQRLSAVQAADLTVGAEAGSGVVADETVTALRAVDGVETVVPLAQGVEVSIVGSGADGRATLATGTVGAEIPALERALDHPFVARSVPHDAVLLPSSEFPPFTAGSEVELRGPDGTVRGLVVQYVDDLPMPSLVAPSVLAEVSDATESRVVWVDVAEGADRARVLDEVSGAAVLGGQLPVSGPLLVDVRVEQGLLAARTVATLLLAVGVAVAVIGAATTGALSAVERRREHAVLRALGLGRPGLRRLLLGRAAVTALVGSVVGVLLGGVLGAVASSLVADALDLEPVASVPVLPVVGLVVVVVLVVRLAVMVPLEKASLVSPARALAPEAGA